MRILFHCLYISHDLKIKCSFSILVIIFNLWRQIVPDVPQLRNVVLNHEGDVGGHGDWRGSPCWTDSWLS